MSMIQRETAFLEASLDMKKENVLFVMKWLSYVEEHEAFSSRDKKCPHGKIYTI